VSPRNPEERTMKGTDAARAVRLCGTTQPDVLGRVLTAGPLSVELDGGQLRYLTVSGVEVLRAVSFLVRDENWGTYVPVISGLGVDQRSDGFSVKYHAVCRRPGQEISFDASIEGSADGGLVFKATAVPATDFLTARTGFVVLHPLKGVVGHAVEVEHVDGRTRRATFPELVDPVQPFLDIRSLTHEVLPGLEATVRFAGDTWEMEDHRNWTDASFKTYVRPLALPWPYTLPAGEAVTQSVTVTLRGTARRSGRSAGRETVEVKLGGVARALLRPLGLGMPPEEIDHALASMDLLRLAAPQFLQCQFDPRANHGLEQIQGYRALCERTGAQCVLEVIVSSVEDYARELHRLAEMIREAGIRLSAVAVCPVGDLKSVLPGGARPPAPPLDALYAAAREAFPGVRLGGGMLSFFTELNRKRPPAKLLDFVMNTTCPIVHAADDRSAMETLAALPYQVTTARSFLNATPYRVGPSSIGCRDNPHGETFTPNPNNERVCLARMDPRQRGCFGAAWALGYVATLARTDVEAISLAAPTGPLGIIYRKTEYAQPWYDSLTGPAVYPVYHVVAGLTRGTGRTLVAAESSDPARVAALAYHGDKETVLWLANLSADEQAVTMSGRRSPVVGRTLDEDTFAQAASDPRTFQAADAPTTGPARLTLKAYAVGMFRLND
jgi:D-apionolactonase